MKYTASLRNFDGKLDILMKKGDATRTVDIVPGKHGFGSSISGGEILFLAIATCYCNDLYREGKKLGIVVEKVEVDVEGDFTAAGEPATNVECRIKVVAQASEKEIRNLVEHTDTIAEIPKSLRQNTAIKISEILPVESRA